MVEHTLAKLIFASSFFSAAPNRTSWSCVVPRKKLNDMVLPAAVVRCSVAVLQLGWGAGLMMMVGLTVVVQRGPPLCRRPRLCVRWDEGPMKEAYDQRP